MSDIYTRIDEIFYTIIDSNFPKPDILQVLIDFFYPHPDDDKVKYHKIR